MPTTVTKEHVWREGNICHFIGTITLDASYDDAGEGVDLSKYMKEIMYVSGMNTEDAPGYILVIDDTNFATPASFTVKVFWFDYDGVADGAAITVLATTNLATVKFRIHAIGKAF